MKPKSILLLCFVSALLGACPAETPNDGGPDHDSDADMGGTDVAADVTASPDAAEDSSPDPDMADLGGPTVLMESEPNDGMPADAVNVFAVGDRIAGAVETDGADIFKFATQPGHLYEVTLTTPPGSQLQAHLTALDDGRDADSPGSDYVKISRDGTLRLLAMGEGGYLFVVRDSRVVDNGTAGGDDHTYELHVAEVDIASAIQGPILPPASVSGALAHAADVQLWEFEATEGTDVVFDLSSMQMDPRLWVFAEQTGSWIARHDDRAADDRNPIIDAPLFASGKMYLVVENIDESPGNLSYTIAAR